MAKKYQWVIALGALLTITAIFYFSSPNIPDPDSFYHIRHAWLYRTQNFLDSQAPWFYYSVIRTLASDLWYGFHLLLIPFTYFNDLILGIKIAGILFTAAALAVYYWIAKRHRLKMAFLWPLLLLVSAPNILYRFLMTRPHIISFALGALLFSFLIDGGIWGMFFVSFGIAWTHLSLAWLAILIGLIVLVVKKIVKKTADWPKLAAVFSGLLLGWLLRPNPIGAAKLVYIQVAKLLFEKQSGLPLLFGRELFPLSPITLFQNFSPFMFLWIPAIFIFIWFYRRQFKNLSDQDKIFAWSGLILSVLFFLLTMLVARRAHDFWIGYGLLFIAFIFTRLTSWKNAAAAFLIGIFIFLSFYTPIKNKTSMETSAVKPNQFKEAALWLKDNSKPGEIVFNLRWSDFPMLFFWNQSNYYIGGMDPIFQYAYNPTLYWKFHYLSADDVTKKTCGAIACTREMLEDTYEVLVKDFNAKYVVLEKQRNPLVYSFLESDPRFEKKLDTKREAVYLVKR